MVDQNGRVYPIKGRHLTLDASTNEAFARWLSGFVNLAMAGRPELSEVDVRALTKSVAPALEDSNFYGTLAAI